MLMKEYPRSVAPPEVQVARLLAASVLRSASVMLGRLARRLRHVERQPVGGAVYEFYAAAGAPEGALYVDGQLVAHLPGVSRL